jgi:uncharacterized protein with von Willebrand factor type A (vWA) domain
MQPAVMAEVEERAAAIIRQKVLEFCHLLRANTLDVTPGKIIDTFRALMLIDCFQREDFYTTLEATLVSHANHRALFHDLFHQFWSGPTWAVIPDPCLPAWEDGNSLPPAGQEKWHMAGWEHHSTSEEVNNQKTVALYSPDEVLTRKDFGTMAEPELLRVQRLISTMARQMATRLSRRKKAGGKARVIDASRTLRRSLRYGGEVVALARRSPKIGKTKIVALCDVSGSMDVYTMFLLKFLYGLQNGLRGTETIVFSTRLTRITPLLRRRNIHAALQLIAETVRDWSGGTKIGTCVQEFNTTMAASMVTSKTLVVIISDGWDTGDTAILAQAMAQLKQRAFRVIWLNPLLGSVNYQPVCKGMSTALPYIDDFIPIHNVDSLRQFGRLVQSLI